ncbi:hypothetical protein D3C78_1533440 [compost metagenome]
MVRPTTVNTSLGWRIRVRSRLSLGLSFFLVKDSVSSMPRRRNMATTAHSAPITKGTRQPQLSSCSVVRVCCRTISTARAMSWPEIRVTYWKLEKKPRCSLVAISDR